MDPYKIVEDFEKAVAEYACAPYAVAVSSCTNALLICCVAERVNMLKQVVIPHITYPGVAASIVHAGGRVGFRDEPWQEKGWYELAGTSIIDSAKYLARGMYQHDTMTCLSFHIRKAIPIGRGGMILTDSAEAAKTLKWLRFDGRNEAPLAHDKLHGVGFNCYLSPAQAARGLELMATLKDENLLAPDPYMDLSQYDFFTDANRSPDGQKTS